MLTFLKYYIKMSGKLPSRKIFRVRVRIRVGGQVSSGAIVLERDVLKQIKISNFFSKRAKSWFLKF